MVLFEIHQGFKGHFLSELRISFKNEKFVGSSPISVTVMFLHEVIKRGNKK